MALHSNPCRMHECVPVVIGGCARSGTTLLQSVLSSHPHVAVVPVETQTLCPTAYLTRPKRFASLQLTELCQHIGEVVTDQSRFWCEKTPRNVLYFRKILRAFGKQTRLINVVRDGRDVVCSIHPDDPNDYWVCPSRWVNDVRAGKKFEKHRQVITIRYEDLVTHYENTVRSLCGFLGLEFMPRLLDYPSHATLQSSNAWSAPARSISPESIGNWRDPAHRERVDELMTSRRAIRLLKYYRYL